MYTCTECNERAINGSASYNVVQVSIISTDG